jgi:hypothetical protein
MNILNNNYNEYFDLLKKRIMILSEKAWDGRLMWKDVENWLTNFDGLTGNTIEQEKLHALYILSEFLYFGSKQIRTLLHALYRDHFLIPVLQEIQNKFNIRDIERIKHLLKNELEKTKFLGVGNPSESGIYLLYYFRQENNLPLSNFIDIADIFTLKKDSIGNYKKVLTNQRVLRYVFIDDVCGSGKKAIRYSENVLSEIREYNEEINFYYLTLFGTKAGLDKVRKKTVFGKNSIAIFELDSTYKILSKNSRYIPDKLSLINMDIVSTIIRTYGIKLWKKHPCGFENNQLVLGMHHNIPNNTIPIIWYESENQNWIPIFKRYIKFEGIAI